MPPLKIHLPPPPPPPPKNDLTSHSRYFSLSLSLPLLFSSLAEPNESKRRRLVFFSRSDLSRPSLHHCFSLSLSSLLHHCFSFSPSRLSLWPLLGPLLSISLSHCTTASGDRCRVPTAHSQLQYSKRQPAATGEWRQRVSDCVQILGITGLYTTVFTSSIPHSNSRYSGEAIDTTKRMTYMQYGRNLLHQIKIVKDLPTTHFQSSDRVFHHPLFYVVQGVRYRKLEVILTTTIDKLGKAGETVKVAPGYFRNHLMPKLLAVPNIDKFAHLISEQRKIYQPIEIEEVKVVSKTEEDILKEYQAAAKRLDSAKLVLKKFIKVDIELREPVTKDEIVSEVARQLCVHIEPENVHLPTPLSSLGEFEVPLRIPKSIPLPEGKIQWTLNVKIRRK